MACRYAWHEGGEGMQLATVQQIVPLLSVTKSN
jgi:hypothetical protein